MKRPPGVEPGTRGGLLLWRSLEVVMEVSYEALFPAQTHGRMMPAEAGEGY